MTIAVGDRLPEATFKLIGPDGPAEVTASEFFKGRTVLLFGVPGAFTPTCHANHLPGYLEHHDELKASGIDEIACVSVNDMFVMDAWSKSSGATGKVTFLADGSAEFIRKIGLELDASGFGMGIRSKRFAMIVEDGVVKSLVVEDVPTKAEETGAEAMLRTLAAA